MPIKLCLERYFIYKGWPKKTGTLFVRLNLIRINFIKYYPMFKFISLSESLIDPFDMLHLISGTNFLRHSEFPIRITHPPLSNIHSNMPV